MKNVMKEIIKEQKFVCNNYNTIPRVMVREKEFTYLIKIVLHI